MQSQRRIVQTCEVRRPLSCLTNLVFTAQGKKTKSCTTERTYQRFAVPGLSGYALDDLKVGNGLVKFGQNATQLGQMQSRVQEASRFANAAPQTVSPTLGRKVWPQVMQTISASTAPSACSIKSWQWGQQMCMGRPPWTILAIRTYFFWFTKNTVFTLSSSTVLWLSKMG